MKTAPETTIGLGKLAPGPGNLGLREQAVRPPGAGEALLEVIATGICGTDLHIVADEFPSKPPVTMGHEVTGVVVAVGPGADEQLIGRRVACETYVHYCGDCEYCRAGKPNLCAERFSIGAVSDGGFARWLTLPARNLHPVPDGVGHHAGALAEPLACVCNCLFDPDVVGRGDQVLVVGPGTIGILTAQVARSAGGGVTIVGLERDTARLKVAAELGLRAMTVDTLPPDEVFAVVCECSGAEGGATLAFDRAARSGRYVQVGIFGRPVTLLFDSVFYKELTVSSGNAHTPRSWERAMALLGQGAVELDPLVTEVVPLAEWERAFSATRAGEGVKLVLDPRQG